MILMIAIETLACVGLRASESLHIWMHYLSALVFGVLGLIWAGMSAKMISRITNYTLLSERKWRTKYHVIMRVL